MIKVTVFSVVEADITQIYDYIVVDNPLEASKMTDKFEKAFEQLSKFPKCGNLIRDKRLMKKAIANLWWTITLLFIAKRTKKSRLCT